MSLMVGMGRRGSGKSTLFYFLACQCDGIIAFDPRGIFPIPDNDNDTSIQRVTKLEGIDKAVNALGVNGCVMVVIQPDAQVNDCFNRMCRAIVANIRQGRWTSESSISILIDEARFVKPEASEEANWLMRFTDKSKVHMMFTVHRPVDLVPDIRAIVDKWYVFHSTHAADLNTIKELCGEAFALQVSRLKPREFMLWDDNEGIGKKFTDAKAWFVPLNVAPSSVPESQGADDGYKLF